MTTRRKLFRTSSENNRSENPGYSYFSWIEELSDQRQESREIPVADPPNHSMDKKCDDSLLYSTELLTKSDIKK